jgi:Na+-driven multidrug efflux pump
LTSCLKNLNSFYYTYAVVVVASYTFIVQISLFSFGFSRAQDVAEKITTTLRLGSEQLSSLPRQCIAKIILCATIACLFAG